MAEPLSEVAPVFDALEMLRGDDPAAAAKHLGRQYHDRGLKDLEAMRRFSSGGSIVIRGRSLCQSADRDRGHAREATRV
jgi:hypothetical protein